MENRKEISISTILLIIAIIGMIAMGIYSYKLTNEKKIEIEKSIELQAKVDNLENKIESMSKDTAEEGYVLLFKQNEISIETGVQTIDDAMEINDTSIKRYNRTFYNYEGGKYVGETVGKFGVETMTYSENYAVVDNVKKIAVSKKYDAIPRDFKEITDIPEQLNRGSYYSIGVHSIDLDGDGNEEKIVCTSKEFNNNEPTASSEIALYDSNYDLIEKLVSIPYGFWPEEQNKDMNHATLLELEDIEYFDIDNDGIMEILIDIPRWEGGEVSIYKYSNSIISGKTGYKVELIP